MYRTHIESITESQRLPADVIISTICLCEQSYGLRSRCLPIAGYSGHLTKKRK